MKRFFLLGLFSFCCFLLRAQNAKNDYVWLRGDTYSIKMFKDWLPPTSAKEYGEPFRENKVECETTTFIRINPHRVDRCGTTISITELKGCRDYRNLYKRDSLRVLSNRQVVKKNYNLVNGGNVKRIVTLVYKADRHPETGELSILKQVNWYLQGRTNVYYISFTSCSMLVELLPQIKMIVASLNEK